MPETGLTLTFDELQKQVADFMIGTRVLRRINPEETERLNAVIFNGLRKFYYPAMLSVELAHDWSFLLSSFEFKTQANVSDYTMPFDFGGTVGQLHHEPADNIRTSITKVTPNRIIQQRQANVTIVNWPTMYAETAAHTGGRSSTRWQMMLWPTPAGEYNLKGRMRILPLAPNGAQIYLYGGPEHSQTIIEACLAEAEMKVDGQTGPHAMAFKECLLTSIYLDASMHGPELIGYNGNGDYRRDSSLYRPDGRGFENFTAVSCSGSS